MFAVVARSTPFSKDIIQLVLSFHEQILSITETETEIEIESERCSWSGFVVKTTDQVIKFLIRVILFKKPYWIVNPIIAACMSGLLVVAFPISIRIHASVMYNMN